MNTQTRSWRRIGVVATSTVLAAAITLVILLQVNASQGARVDLTAWNGFTIPTTTIDTGPIGTITTRTAAFTFSSAGGAGGNPEFKCVLTAPDAPDNTGDFGTQCSTGLTGSKTYTSLADGVYTFAVTAFDTGGGTDRKTRTFTVDATAPTAAITSGPATSTTETSATFVFNSAATDLGHLECSRDGAAFATCTSPQALTAFAVGNHTFAVRGVDAAGNVGVAAMSAWTVTAPVVPVVPVVTPVTPEPTPDTEVSVVVLKPAAVVRPNALRNVSVARITCNELAAQVCEVTTKLVSTKVILIGKKRVRVNFGVVKSDVTGGTMLVQKLGLSRAEIQLIRRLHSIPVKATSVVLDAAGNSKTVTTTFVLRVVK